MSGRQLSVNHLAVLRYGISLVLTVVLLAIVACNREPQWQVLPLPELPPQPVVLRAAYVENTRFAGVTPAQQQAILDKTEQLVQQHFGLHIRFAESVEQIDIASFFDNLLPHVREYGKTRILPLTTVSDEHKARLQDSIYRTLENYSDDRQRVVAFAQPYLLRQMNDTGNSDLRELAARLTDTLLQRLQYWSRQKAPDGKPVLDGSPYNEWVWWDTLGYGNVAYDVVLTNQLVASAEFYGMDVHSSLRGGITAGTTAYSHHSRFRTYSWVSLYPLLNSNPVLDMLRDDASYDHQQIVDYAAAILAHELGHLLLHLGHPFGSSACIMSPMPLLKYREWFDGLNASACPPGSEPQMTPGVAKIEYRADW